MGYIIFFVVCTVFILLFRLALGFIQENAIAMSMAQHLKDNDLPIEFFNERFDGHILFLDLVNLLDWTPRARGRFMVDVMMSDSEVRK